MKYLDLTHLIQFAQKKDYMETCIVDFWSDVVLDNIVQSSFGLKTK